MSTESKTYEGNCHCGAIKFSVVLPPLETTPLQSCACSICTKKGYLFVFPSKSAITLTKGAGTDGLGAGVLASYEFNSKQVSHRFCGTCGTAFGIVCTDLADDDARFALNARMFRDVDLWGLGLKENPGPTTPLAYTPPVFPGLAALVAEPLGEGEKIYPGSCHCGAVTFAVKSPWLLETTGPADVENNQVLECDCSTCLRHAGMYTYPRPLSRAPMEVSPPDALATYFSPLGKQFGATQFCRVCGCVLFQKIVGPPAARVVVLPPNVQAMIREKCAIRPVQVRALDFALGLTAEDKEEWARVRGALKRERGSLEGTPTRFTAISKYGREGVVIMRGGSVEKEVGDAGEGGGEGEREGTDGGEAKERGIGGGSARAVGGGVEEREQDGGDIRRGGTSGVGRGRSGCLGNCRGGRGEDGSGREFCAGGGDEGDVLEGGSAHFFVWKIQVTYHGSTKGGGACDGVGKLLPLAGSLNALEGARDKDVVVAEAGVVAGRAPTELAETEAAKREKTARAVEKRIVGSGSKEGGAGCNREDEGVAKTTTVGSNSKVELLEN
ncbi:hypothetical protein DFH09DRAFT_1278562 [Mycena vulgaris]|nr:hypothetical protein DFH09DRAFT_1278562 [Mycena vulgaris]